MSSPHILVRHGDASYPVYIGRGLTENVGSLVRQMTAARPIVISSARVFALHGERLIRSFTIPPPVVIAAEGEKNKTLTNAERVIGDLLRAGAKRDSVAVVHGGGMLGDLAGFAAAMFMRGIPVVHVPTTLLAQVDSSIGGKTAVNHPLGKNLIGAFHRPLGVISDVDVLRTLDGRELRSGLFEAIKAGVVRHATLFDFIDANLDAIFACDAQATLTIVRAAASVKVSIVSEDERESGLRRLLNYGHTIGHALEAAGEYEDLTHGEAVGWGMIAATAIAQERGILSKEDARRIGDLVLRLAPTAPKRLDVRELLHHIDFDKKASSDVRVMILPRTIGTCEIVRGITDDEIARAIASIG